MAIETTRRVFLGAVGAAGAATAAGSQVGASQLAAGQATAAGTVGSSNALTSGLNNALSQGSLAYLLQNQPASSGGYQGSTAWNPAGTPNYGYTGQLPVTLE